MSDEPPIGIAPVVIILLIIACVIVICIRRCRRNQTVGYVEIIEQPSTQQITVNVTHPIHQGIPQSQYQPQMDQTQQYPYQYAPHAPAVNKYGGQQHYQTGVQVGMMQHDGNPGMHPSPQPPFNPASTPFPYGQASGSDLPPPYEGICNPSAPKSHDFK